MNRTIRHFSRRSLGLALALGLAALVFGCAPESGHDPRATDAGETILVELISPDSGLAAGLVLPARVKAHDEVTVSARLIGRVSTLLAREGDAVNAGQPLARFDAPESRLALEAARREYAAARATRDAAVRQAARLDSLLARGIASPREREVVGTDRGTAEARFESAAAAVEGLEAALVPRAPFAGVIARRHVDAGADVAPGMALFDLRSRDGIELVTSVPESALPGLEGARWDVEVARGRWRPARLTRLDGMTDAATRTRGAILVPESAVSLEPGAFARVRMRAAGLPASAGQWLPASAIVRRGALRGVFVVAHDRAELRWLQLGREEGDRFEVLAGLAAGERVARDARGLEDGAAVRGRP